MNERSPLNTFTELDIVLASHGLRLTPAGRAVYASILSDDIAPINLPAHLLERIEPA